MGRRQSRGDDDIHQLLFVRVPHHPRYAGQSGNFLRCALGIASRDHNLTLGIFPMNPPDGCPGILVGRGGHGASIQHHDRGLLGVGGSLKAALGELPLYSGPVGLSSSAPKILYVKAGHANIVRYQKVQAGCEVLTIRSPFAFYKLAGLGVFDEAPHPGC